MLWLGSKYCHYCGRSVTVPKSATAERRFKCSKCDAENFLDQDGNITDPPPSVTNAESATSPTSPRFGRDVRSGADDSTGQSFVFCDTCQKNQHLLVSARSNLNPPSEHSPEWKQYEEHLRTIERRYPQYCVRCAPGATAAIQKSMYIARSSQMLEVMKRTRAAPRRDISGFGRFWRSMLLWVAGAGWLLSLIMQLGWHALGSRVDKFETFQRSLVSLSPMSDAYQQWQLRLLYGHLSDQLITATLDPKLFAWVAGWMHYAQAVALLCFWWNPCLRRKYLEVNRGRMVGTRDYYLAQGIAFLFRAASFVLLTHPAMLGVNWRVFQKLHIAAALVLVILTSYSYTRVSVNPRPPIQLRRFKDAEILPVAPEDIAAAAAEDHPLARRNRAKQPLSMDMLSDMPVPSNEPAPARVDGFASRFARREATPQHYGSSSARAPSVGDPMDVESTPFGGAFSSTASLSNNLPYASSHDNPYSLRSRKPANGYAQATDPLRHGRAAPENNDNGGSFDQRYKGFKKPIVEDDDDDDDSVASAPVTQGASAPQKSKRDNSDAFNMDMAPTRLWLSKDKAETGLEDMFSQVLGTGSFAQDDASDDEGERLGARGTSTRARQTAPAAGQNYGQRTIAAQWAVRVAPLSVVALVAGACWGVYTHAR